ncbi:DMT family transporter [Rhodobacteraceae bacterium NNCM2]|nr:DMT family transporter [Coraliihabitans acroporae]
MTDRTFDTPSVPHPLILWAVLFGSGIAWGATQLFSKISVSTGHPAIGIVFWQTAIGAVLLLLALFVTGRRLPFRSRHVAFYLVCGFLGTAFPHSMSYTYMKHLPVGIASILIAVIPMMTLVLAVVVGIDRADWRRVLGLGLGAVAVMLILVPEASLPEQGQWLWALLPLVTAFAYACENVVIAKYQPGDSGALETMAGLTIAALVMVVPMMLAEGAWVDLSAMGTAEQAIAATSVLHVLAYFGLVWLIGQAGPIFTAQIGYIVTLSGVFLGMVFMGEVHAHWVWLSLALMLVGLSFVKAGRRG